MPRKKTKSRSRKKIRRVSARRKTRRIGGASNKLDEPRVPAKTKRENTIMIGQDGFYWQVVNGIWAKSMSQEALGALYEEYQKQKQKNKPIDKKSIEKKLIDKKSIDKKSIDKKPIIIEKSHDNKSHDNVNKSNTNEQIEYLISRTENVVDQPQINKIQHPKKNKEFSKSDFGIKPTPTQKIKFDVLDFRFT
jgi:hypothetical protein